MSSSRLRIDRRFTTAGEDPLDAVEWVRRDSKITNPDGSVVFEMKGAEVPAGWSQVASDIIVSKYFRKAGVPQYDDLGEPLLDDAGRPVLGPERSARQTISRLAATWRHWGETSGYFESAADADAFEDELKYMLVHQIASPNSPQWFNTGIHHHYGVTGTAQGFWYVDPETNETVESDDAYSRPAPHACFINGVDDDLVNPGGIMDLWVKEARLFKFGSGCTSEKSRIFVEGSGFVPIRSLFDRFVEEGRPVHDFDGMGTYIDIGDANVHTLSVDDGTGIYRRSKVELVWKYAVDAGNKLTVAFDTGARATVSAWHPFLVWDGERVVERRADELRRRDAVLGPNETVSDALPVEPHIFEYDTSYFRRAEHHAVPISTELSWLIGYFMGDGSLGINTNTTTNAYGTRYQYRKPRLRFHDETSETLQRVISIAERAFGETASIQPDRRRSAGNTVTFIGRRITGFFNALFNPGPKSHSLEMPSFVLSGGRNIALAFLAGLIDSDGTVNEGRASYTTASQGFAEEVAALASALGLGGGIVRNGSVSTVAVVRRSTELGPRLELAAHMTHPNRSANLTSDSITHERKFCMPLSEGLTTRLFGDHHAGEWFQVPVGGDTFHLGRLHYEGLINPHKLNKAVALLDRDVELTARLGRIARSLAFVTAVEPCQDDPEFFDLTVRDHSNYLAGENGLVAIHNTGTNFSRLRAEGEPLSGGGRSSGLMSFLKVGDRAAGAIKSGGTTRRAAKMVILDADHPDIEKFVDWKVEEEKKVRALVAAGYSADFNGEAYATVAGQNSNNSVRVTNEFLQAVADDDNWELTARTDGSAMKVIKARDLWIRIAKAAWECADPGVQFHTTIQEWHTSPAGGEIRATNPCSEYVFLDNTACNLASINLVEFHDQDGGEFDVDAYRHAIRLWTIVLEISVTMAQFPSAEIARGSYDYRTLGLGYANLGSLLMRSGIAYDSDEGRAIAGAVTAILTGTAYATSAEMAAAVGSFPRFADNREAMLRVMRNHRRAAYDVPQDEYEGVSHHVSGIDATHAPRYLVDAARRAWDEALAKGEEHGYRNAQATCLAPTGTIGLQMDCDTTGVEPDFALVKFKKLAGGGYFKIANQSIAPALRRLGYNAEQRHKIISYVVGTSTLEGAPYINPESLRAKGFTDEDIEAVENTLPGVFELSFAFNRWTLGDDALERLGFTAADYTDPSFSLLAALGFSPEGVQAANDIICGRQTIEGAPGLKTEHLAVFDTANKNGRHGKRFIHHMGHVRMMAAAQPFISGAISKTINVPHEATIADIEECYQASWELGLKAVALYRDGSKASQPLSSSSSDEGVSEEEAEGLEEAIETDIKVAAGLLAPAPGVSPAQAYADRPRPRFILPARRRGFTQEARIGGHKVFVRTGEYDDGSLGELFIDLAKEGATLRGILSCFAIAVSKGLQYGVPLEEFVDTFTFHTFEPRGMVEGHPNIKMANSIVDYVFRSLGLEYLGRTDLVQVPPVDDRSLPEPPKGLAAESAGTQLDLAAAQMEQDIAVQVRAAEFVDADPNGAPALAGGPGMEVRPAAVQTEAVQAALSGLMGDAPLCDNCGHITVRNGSCYRCLNCGNSLGCS